MRSLIIQKVYKPYATKRSFQEVFSVHSEENNRI